jgi:hypothetical protein
MKCQHYCPGCSMGHCPKMRALADENLKLKEQVSRLLVAIESDGVSGE